MHTLYNQFIHGHSPLEMCAARAFVRRGVRSNVWRGATFPDFLLYRPAAGGNVRSESRMVASTYKRTS